MKKNLFFMLAGIVLLSSCGDENSTTPVVPSDGTVPLSIANAFLSASLLRSSQPLEDGSIGLFRGTASGYTAMNNVKYSWDGESWTADPTAITLSKSDANICAYNPYNAALTSLPFTLTSAPWTAAADISYVANQQASSTSSSIALDMIRAYSKITFSIKKDANYPLTGAITSMTIASAGLKTSNTLDISSGIYGTTTATGTYTHGLTIASLSETAVNKEYLMVPCELTGNTTLTLTVDGNPLQGTITNATLLALVAGTNHIIKVTVSGATLNIGSVTTTDWANATEIPLTL